MSAADLSITQLQQHKQSLEQEVSYMTDTVAKLKAAQQAYDMSGKVLSTLGEKKNAQVLVPLTNSVYVAGQLGECDSVLVNIGTGYFVNKPVLGAQTHCEEKSKLLNSNLVKMARILSEKRNNLEMCMMLIQKKMAQ